MKKRKKSKMKEEAKFTLIKRKDKNKIQFFFNLKNK